MSIKKLPVGERKVKLSITIDNELNTKLMKITNNKSNFIEQLLLFELSKYENI